jgi:hypothetical protein
MWTGSVVFARARTDGLGSLGAAQARRHATSVWMEAVATRGGRRTADRLTGPSLRKDKRQTFVETLRWSV